MTHTASPFSRLRGFFWPIHRMELGQYLPIFLVSFLLGVNYHILRNLKYGLLVLAPDAGAEAIPFVQLWGLVPGAVLMTWLLAVLCRRMSQRQVFYVTITGFLIFFALFQFVLYPHREQLEPSGLVSWLSNHLPVQLGGFVAIVRHWVISLFYVAAELWKVSVLAVLFWGFINTNLPIGKATRFYGPLMLASSLAGIVGGKINSIFPHAAWVQVVGIGESPWQRTLSVMMILVISLGILVMLLFQKIASQLPSGSSSAGAELAHRKEFSIRAALRSLRKSRYLLSLGFIVAIDYVAFGLAEILWKDQLRTYFPDPGQFTAYTGEVVFWASILSLVVSALLSGGLINRLGWRFAALVPPFVLLFTSLAFYGLVLLPDTPLVSASVTKLGMSPLAAAVFIGGIHNCLCRVAKYTLVDPTKELAFVPLDRQTQLQGKALIDGIGTHAGRAGGALVQQMLLLGFPSVLAGAPISFAVVLGTTLLWIRSVVYVGGRYRDLVKKPKVAIAS